MKHTEGLVKEASKKETALKKRNEELKSAKEELMKGVVARDEVNIQYVERLLAAEKMLAKSNGGEEFVALQDRLKKDREKRERARKDMQEENDLLRRLNEALSIKIKDLEDPASPTKKLTSMVSPVIVFLRVCQYFQRSPPETFILNMIKSLSSQTVQRWTKLENLNVTTLLYSLNICNGCLS